MPDTPQPVDFLTVDLPNGQTWTRLDRLTDGRIMCALCFEYTPRDQLYWSNDGEPTDVCQPCAAQEAGGPNA